MSTAIANLSEQFRPGSLVSARGREWVVLPGGFGADLLRLRPLGGAEEDSTVIYLPLEPVAPHAATFPPPDPAKTGAQAAALLLRDALRLKLRAGAGPFRSFGNIAVEPRAYQLVPLLMALKMDTVRLLIADDVGIGKTIEGGLIARELLDRGEINRIAVLCPPHLCDQWQGELASKFGIQAEIVRTGTASRLERGLPQGQSIFDVYPFTVVSLDYIKSDRRRAEFIRACPEFVIIEEAHASVGTGAESKNQRLTVLRGLAERPDRHMVFLTATPHSGDDSAFHNLLSLLHSDFRALQGMTDGSVRQRLRERLALQFVQRRRADIAEWRDAGSVFPDRQTAEATYVLSGEWGQLFDEVLDYARTMVKRTEGQSALRQRMSWWAALALLRCVSSSPASAVMALTTRLRAVEGASEADQIDALDEQGADAVFDGTATDSLTSEDAAPAGLTDDIEASPADAEALRNLLTRTEALRGSKRDPKLRLLIARVEALVAEGFRPVIFCRFIQTAHYVGEHLKAALDPTKQHVEVITGQLQPEDRLAKIDELAVVADGKVPVLVATDCLSEGINLQALFSAVVHYDLSWNPTRHEQREGRVDRFGQPEKNVRALILYGENNPVDGAVLKVIVRKAERIRKELGVSVPVPADTNKVTEAILQTVLLQSGRVADGLRQATFDFGKAEAELDMAWESAKENARQTRTVFAQARLKPDEVLPEWNKAVAALGGEEDVRRFVRQACERCKTACKSFQIPGVNSVQ
jgi:superfamily II DNA or RNA helicase